MFTQYWWSSGAEANGGFQVGNSLRFRGAQILQRTSTTDGNRRTWTWSGWTKKTFSGIDSMHLFRMQNGGNTEGFRTSGFDQFEWTTASLGAASSSARFRDPSAWYHIVQVLDTTQATETERVRLYINGVRSPYQSYAGPQQDAQGAGGGPGTYAVGGNNATFPTNAWEGYIADVYFIDGQALEPTAFGFENNNGVWVPRQTNFTSAQYGANGFHLDFHDPDNLGEDVAPTGTGHTTANNFTANGFNTDPVGQFSTNLFTGANGSTGFDFAARDNNFAGGANGPAAGFDNNNGTFCFALANQSINLVCNLTGITQIVVRTDQTQTYSFAVNQTAVTATRVIDGGAARQTLDLPAGFNGNLTLLSIRGSTTAMTPGFSGIFINGRAGALVDNTGADYDHMVDTPTSNYATLSPVLPTVDAAFADGNLRVTSSNASGPRSAPVAFGLRGRFYWEVRVVNTATIQIGISRIDNFQPAANGFSTSNGCIITPNGNLYNFGTLSTGGSFTYANGDVIGLDYNSANNQITFTRNGGSAFTATLGQTHLMVPLHVGDSSGQVTVNYGQQPFLYRPAALTDANNVQTQNLPAATIANGRDHFRAITGPGSGGYQLWSSAATDGTLGIENFTERGPCPGTTVEAAQFILDCFLDVTTTSFTISSGWGWAAGNAEVSVSTDAAANSWTVTAANQSMGNNETVTVSHTSAFRYFKLRYLGTGTVNFGDISSTNNPILFRAQQAFPTGLWWIKSRVADANTTQHMFVDSVRGQVGGNWQKLNCPNINNGDQNYTPPAGNSVAWCWNAPDEWASTDDDVTAGTLASSGRRNAAAGFSIVAYQGNGTAGATVAHGLRDGNGAATPDFIIVKNRVAANTEYQVRHRDLGGNQWSLRLNSNAQRADFNAWNNSPPNNNHIVLGPVNSSNGNGNNMIAYCWTAIPNYSAFGVYQGNNDPNGVFIYTGMRPAWILIKRLTNADHWAIYDTTRDEHNPAFTILRPDQAAGEDTNAVNNVDILSNGFKWRTNDGRYNGNEQYVYAAFAEMPFGSSNTSPANAR